jgi:DNA-binding response OmpR family regulator
MDTIVIVDDNLEILELVKLALKSKYEVKAFSKGEDAIQCIYNITPKLFILDIQMPEMDGYELCSTFKSMDETKNVPVVFLSAKTGSNTRSLAFKLGAISYLEKPIEIIELRSLVDSIVEQTSQRKENIIKLLDFELNIDLNTAKDSSGEYKLTQSEVIIITSLVKNFSQPISRERLASLFSTTEKNTFRNIDTHISSIRKKIKNSKLSIVTIYGVGYSLIELNNLKSAA